MPETAGEPSTTYEDWVRRDAAVVWNGFTQMAAYSDSSPVVVGTVPGGNARMPVPRAAGHTGSQLACLSAALAPFGGRALRRAAP